jgi:hypothetical protein
LESSVNCPLVRMAYFDAHGREPPRLRISWRRVLPHAQHAVQSRISRCLPSVFEN